jgi:hypothetical protein
MCVTKLKLIDDRRSAGQSILVSGFHLEPMARFFFPVWQLQVSWCGAPSLTRGWACNLLVQLLLGLARTVTLRSNSRRTHDHISLSHLRLPQPGGPDLHIPQKQVGPDIPPGTGFPFRRLLRLPGLRWRNYSPPPFKPVTTLCKILSSLNNKFLSRTALADWKRMNSRHLFCFYSEVSCSVRDVVGQILNL